MMNRILTAAAVLMCTATIAIAQGGYPPPQQDSMKPGMKVGKKLFEGIDLTNDQKTQINAINDKYRAQNQANAKASMDAMQKARQANDTAGMRAAREQMASVYTPEQEQEILNVLTPAQRERYNKNKAEMKKHMQEKMNERMKEGQGPKGQARGNANVQTQGGAQ